MKKILPESGSCKFDIQRPNIILSQPTSERGSIVIQHRSQGSNPITFHEHSIWPSFALPGSMSSSAASTPAPGLNNYPI
jgi:hypothetical protein